MALPQEPPLIKEETRGQKSLQWIAYLPGHSGTSLPPLALRSRKQVSIWLRVMELPYGLDPSGVPQPWDYCYLDKTRVLVAKKKVGKIATVCVAATVGI